MPESLCHQQLVDALVTWLAKHCLGDDTGAVLRDALDAGPSDRPPLVGQHRPDVYVAHQPSYKFIIGEAKSPWDLENRHTESQLTEFMTYCNNHPRSLFVLAVPWHRVPCAKNILNQLQRKCILTAVEVKVLEQLPG